MPMSEGAARSRTAPSARRRRPQVQGVDHAGLRGLCLQLAEDVRTFDPDVVVGISTGGADVAAEIARALGGDRRLVIVKSQRPGTRIKQGRLVSHLIGSLPQPLADLARWAEVEYREASYYLRLRLNGTDRTQPETRIQRPEAFAAAVAGASRVLVVDDTLDSGQTVSGVVSAARSASAAAEVRTAVIATTWRRPPLQADYVLAPRLLLRLPSSFDA